MNIPDVTSSIWTDIVSGRVKHPFKFMATRVMLSRIVPHVQRDPSPSTILQNVRELREMLVTNGHLPSAQHDLQLICGGGR